MTAGDLKRPKLPAGMFAFYSDKSTFPRMLGYKQGFPEDESAYGPAEIGERFWGSHLRCQGDEESLEDCPRKEFPSCTRGEVAGVICYLGGIDNEYYSKNFYWTKTFEFHVPIDMTYFKPAQISALK